MQRVSKAYKKSMKSSLRERSYIMISFGLMNQAAQANARVNNSDCAEFSNNSTVFRERKDALAYATLEENFTRVDGSMYFLPRSAGAGFYDTGIVSNRLVSEQPFEMTISLTSLPTNIKGFTIDFGENYPVDFDIVGSTGQTLEFRNNGKARWSTEEVLSNTTSVRMVFRRMKNPQSRLRIYSIVFGYGLVYHNDSVVDSTLESYVSPIGAEVPQFDFSVTLKNYDHYFNVDNPNSAVNFLETGQEMNIVYGYQTPGSPNVEWIQGARLLCSEWESDDHTAIIRCQDVFRNMSGEYIRGRYSAVARSYYELAEDILKEAKVKEYYLDPRLKTLFTNNPVPRVKYKEALQIIANACRCVLTFSRDGKIQIKSNFMPKSTVSANGEESYSRVANVLNDSVKKEYATLAGNYTEVDASMHFLQRDGAPGINTGYVSRAVSGADGTFTENPVVTVRMEAIRAYYGLKMEFGSTLPSEFIIHVYRGEELVNEYPVGSDEIDKITVILREFDDFDVMKIEFTKTAEPNNRIVLNSLSLTDVADFTMNRRDMLSFPRATKLELVKDIVVPCYLYQENTKEDNLIYEDTETVAGKTETYYIQEPSYGYRVKLDGVEHGVDIIESGDFFITVRFNVSGAHKLEITGRQYRVIEKHATVVLNTAGRSVVWKNPLINDLEMANDLAKWLAEYYTAGVEYEYDTRGNPELDTTDIIYQENEFRNDMKVEITHQVLNFKQAFSGRITARRMGG